MLRKGAFVFLALLFVFTVAFVASIAFKSPSHQRNWKKEYAVLPAVDFDGSLVKIRNIRNFDYGSDGAILKAGYYDKQFEFNELKSLWYGISHFYDYGLAHTFLSFGFANGTFLTVSVEARQEIGESYHPLTGLLRNYELIFILVDERDVVGLRTHIRNERVYLYEINVPLPAIERLLRIMLRRVNEIRERPEFYNTLTDNCTTSLLRHAKRLSLWDIYFDYRVVLPGYSDELAYELRVIPTDAPLSEVRERYRLDPSRTSLDDPAFSRKIRGLSPEA